MKSNKTISNYADVYIFEVDVYFVSKTNVCLLHNFTVWSKHYFTPTPATVLRKFNNGKLIKYVTLIKEPT